MSTENPNTHHVLTADSGVEGSWLGNEGERAWDPLPGLRGPKFLLRAVLTPCPLACYCGKIDTQK